MPDALEGTLTPRQRGRFAQHVDECPECGPMLRGLIRLRAALRSIATDTSDPDGYKHGGTVVPAVLEHLRAHPSERRPMAGRSPWRRA
jgi:hypothetical protein